MTQTDNLFELERSCFTSHESWIY